ncbi:class I SAM-dependent methyltransferase [Streptomyces sp. TR02-1]|uniref:class I SAM-dependent methyltransferase n=1 Tax=Streptomyces sp. TR02-1 TaxID=3385977 RepID=UPI0039A3ABF7
MRQHLVARQLDEQVADRFPGRSGLRVLEVGVPPAAGAWSEAVGTLRLARAGHHVTLLEPDPEVRADVLSALEEEPSAVRRLVRLAEGDAGETGAHFLPRTFDVVLCHGVLAAASEPVGTLAGLARVLAPGGLLSVLVRNEAATALHSGRTGDWDATLAAFDAVEPTFGLETMTALLSRVGAPLHAWYGVEVFTPGTETTAAVPRQLAAEERAGRTDPYRSVAAHLHLCGVRGASSV